MRKLAIAALALAVVLTMTALRVVDLRWSRAAALKSAESRAASLAVLLAEYIGETFSAGDASLRQLALHSQQVGGPLAPATTWTPSLASARAGLTSIGAMSVVDRQGIIRHSTRPDIVGQSRRDDFMVRTAFAGPGDGLIVGAPFRTAVGRGGYVIPIGRRLVGLDGMVEGLVVASFIPAARRGVFKTVDVGTHGTVWVFHPTGVVLFREPSPTDAIGASARDNAIFSAALANGDGLLRSTLTPGGPVMLSAYHTAAAAGIIVAVSLDRDDVLADWRHEAVGSAAVIAAVAGTLGVVLLGLFRQMDARGRVEIALSRAQQLEAEHLRETNERLASSLEREQGARRDAESANTLKDQFLMTVSHELRTPLTAIYGWARMLNQGAVGEARMAVALQAIERNAAAQTRLIDDLLDVSRAMTGTIRLDVTSVDIAAVVRGAVETVGPAAHAKNIHVDLQVDPAVGRVRGDAERLQQIAWNLLSNAVKFTPDGGRVSTAVTRTGDEIAITVTDTGDGIPAAFLPHVFERFRQADPGTTRRHGGLGLGLAIVRNLVELHGGSVAARSDGEGRGATFIVRLPARETATGADAGSTLPDAAGTGPTAKGLGGVHVLVVDDDPAARDLFAAILESAGAPVTTAASAAEALKALETTPFDLLLSDIEMPAVDGYHLVQQAKTAAHRRGRRLMTIAVTAYGEPEDEARSIAAGFDRHVRKPVEPDALIAVVAALAATRSGVSATGPSPA